MPQQHDIQTQEYTRHERGRIPLVVLNAQLPHKKEAHSRKDDNDRHQVANVEFLPDYERPEYQYVDRSGVLEEDRIRGLETGADDFVTKPFSPKELVARAKAVLRRSNPNLVAEKLSYGGLEMDTSAHRVRHNETRIELGPTEYRLLRHFMQHPEKVFSRQQLLDRVWPHNEDIEMRTVDVHIRRLRHALENGGAGDIIRTVRSEGYSLDATV